MTDELALRRAINEAYQARRLELMAAYRAEITDWCHYELAIELACKKTGATEKEMRAIACSAGVWS